MSEQSAARIAADSLGLHVLREIVDQFMQLPGFSNLTQAQQQVHVERLDKTVRSLIAEALGVIFSDVDRTAESRHELMDRSGQKVVIVMADPDRYYQRMTEVKAQADQRDMFHDSSQPLGHMGVDQPPGSSDPPAPPADVDYGGDGLDDVIPQDDANAAPIDMVTADTVWAALQAIGPPVEIIGDGIGLWTEEMLHEAMVWALAAKQFWVDGKALPAAPESLHGRILFSEPAMPPTLPESHAPEPIPTADDIVGITAALKQRGIPVKGKQVSKWSQSQRIAAVSWLAGRSASRPDFIPAPDGTGEVT
jgi:hypothetical protein